MTVQHQPALMTNIRRLNVTQATSPWLRIALHQPIELTGRSRLYVWAFRFYSVRCILHRYQLPILTFLFPSSTPHKMSPSKPIRRQFLFLSQRLQLSKYLVRSRFIRRPITPISLLNQKLNQQPAESGSILPCFVALMHSTQGRLCWSREIR